MNEIKNVVNTNFDLLNPTVIYDNGAGSNATITLTDNISNYSYLEIIYGWDAGTFGLQSEKIDLSNGYAICLNTSVYNNNRIYWAVSKWTASTNKITLNGGEYWSMTASASVVRNQSNLIAIFKVLGYK